jgi:hypothetical protein
MLTGSACGRCCICCRPVKGLMLFVGAFSSR